MTLREYIDLWLDRPVWHAAVALIAGIFVWAMAGAIYVDIKAACKRFARALR